MNQSIWEVETFYKNRDIIIIGAGFSGLWSAISLKEKYPEKSVLVLEKSPVPMGASTRNAGFACFGSLTEIISDSETMGWEKTLNLVQLRYEGLKKIQTYFKNSDIDFENCGGFEIINNRNILEYIEEVNGKLKAITGAGNTFALNQKKIEEFGLDQTAFLVENTFEGSLHPGKLLQKLVEKAHFLGIEFLFGTEVLEISEEKDNVKIITENFQIKSEKVVIATNGFANELISDIDLIAVRGQILLTEPIENLKLKGTFHYDEGFIYFRNLGNRILLGGGRNQDFKTEETTDLETTELLQNYLENFLKEVILPHQDFQISHRWSGIMAMGKEKSPIVEKISPRQIVAVRLSGMGVALAPKIGELVAKLL